MLECERIKNSGKLNVDFFNQEYRCGYCVDSEMKKIWAIGLDLYLEFARICQEYNLTHFMIYGTLLGCIRHEGFIPWDNDIDIGMPRKDYDKFITLADEFKMPYFLQLPWTDEKSAFTIAKLRNSNTTSITYPFRYQRMNHGISIDIVPIDKVNLNDVDSNYSRIRELALQNSSYMRLSNPNPDENDKKRIKNWKCENPQKIYDLVQKICKQYENTQQDYVGIMATTVYECERQVYRAEDFDKIVWKTFEGLRVPVPQGYDNILKTTYKQYMELPPMSERVTHEKNFFDPDCSYTSYLK